jgi:hypothetical protein
MKIELSIAGHIHLAGVLKEHVFFSSDDRKHDISLCQAFVVERLGISSFTRKIEIEVSFQR